MKFHHPRLAPSSFALALVLCAALAAPTAAHAQVRPRLLQGAALAPVAGEVIVAFKPGASVMQKHALAARMNPAAVRSVLDQRARSLGARVGRVLEAGDAVGDRTQVMRAAGLDATTLARQLAADPEVAYAVPNGRKRIVAAPNDPLYLSGPSVNLALQTGGPVSGQWYLRAPDGTARSAINIEGAWARTTGSANVVVAVLDTGVRYEHPDLSSRLLPGYDMVANPLVANDGDGRDSNASDPGDWVTAAEAGGDTFPSCSETSSSWHGTATAALVGAVTGSTPAVGMAGSAPGVRVLPVRVLGKCFGSDSDILAGMRWAAGIPLVGVPVNPHPAQVINMSLGGRGGCSAAYQAVVDEITALGVTIVVAAGNSVNGPVNEPANCRGVIGVVALRHAGSKVGFSDLGPEISIAAPGGNCINVTSGSPCLYPVLTATNTGLQGPGASSWSDAFNSTVGTSFSSPLVAGVAALMMSRQPTLTPAALRTAMQSSARPFPSSGADNGTDPTVVPSCRRTDLTGASGQCYCPNDGTLCGAGMLDADAAVAAVSTTPFVNATFSPAAPVAGELVRFSLSGLQTPSGGAAQTYAWTLLDGGGAANGFSTSSNADTASIATTAGGTMRVLLTVTDAAGGSVSAEHRVAVLETASASPPPIGGAPDGGGGGGGGGGGASSGAWVAGVALAAAVLRALRRRA